MAQKIKNTFNAIQIFNPSAAVCESSSLVVSSRRRDCDDDDDDDNDIKGSNCNYSMKKGMYHPFISLV